MKRLLHWPSPAEPGGTAVRQLIQQLSSCTSRPVLPPPAAHPRPAPAGTHVTHTPPCHAARVWLNLMFCVRLQTSWVNKVYMVRGVRYYLAPPGNTLSDPFIIAMTSPGTCAINLESDLPSLAGSPRRARLAQAAGQGPPRPRHLRKGTTQHSGAPQHAAPTVTCPSVALFPPPLPLPIPPA